MSGTFDCPFCGAKYPIKPVLVGRAVRCTTCKNPFKLRPDGVADKVEDAPPPPPPPAVPAAVPAPSAPASLETPAAPKVSPATTDPGSSNGPRPAPRATRSGLVTKQQEEQRKSLAANLASAASAALAADSVKRETEKDSPRTKSGRIKRKTEGSVGDISPAVLTGYGEDEHRNNMHWLIGAIVIVAGLMTLIVLFSLKGPERKALNAYAAVVEGERGRFGEREEAIQERAWIMGAPALESLGTVSIGAHRDLDLSLAHELLTGDLKDAVLLEELGVWVPAEQAANAQKNWDAKRSLEQNIAHLGGFRIKAVPQRAIIEQLTGGGWSQDDVDVLIQLLRGRTGRKSENWIATKLSKGEFPTSIELCTFTGRKGVMLQNLGRSYKRVEVDYQGQLLRFVGPGWPAEWKVFSISIATNSPP